MLTKRSTTPPAAVSVAGAAYAKVNTKKSASYHLAIGYATLCREELVDGVHNWYWYSITHYIRVDTA